MDFKIVSQKKVFKAELFEVEETKIQLNKNIKTYDDIYRKPTVSVFPLTNLYEIYLISEYRRLHKKNVLAAVAGFVNEGESTLNAARRELKEETGIIAAHWEEIARIEMAASVIKATSHLFLAKGLEIEKPALEEDEKITLIKLPLSKAVEKVMLGEINISPAVIGILLIDKLKREKKI